ncbi:hypothetical protein TraAM80_02782 [Trypanosoma rangeli]|uniref:Uncharacterized protein n=1 Tax=Trypanosoma rangeli TaxID=5698 RepID=A0A422NST4_TRYRA|nr:uncharacterized protein TraAM80_02782 [Trypanosoma rangeli]RNF08545.1 hypothetical protein TraAM80_02782 [Trypanosoma rangeli]|eukprot:RNF08545.1 hypothetical protein TraAM80_02782 [Trypanosoma rangeli]
MTWIAIDRSSKGSLFSVSHPMQRAGRPAGPALQPRLRTSRATGDEDKPSQKGGRRVTRGQGKMNGSSRNVSAGGRSHRRGNSKGANSTREKEGATSDSSLATQQEEEQVHRYLDSAWEKFGEARVLLRQNCFLEAWKILMEAKDFIDAAACHYCCGLDRQNRALVQLGHELNAATQSWLRWERLAGHPGLSDSLLPSGKASTVMLQTQKQAEQQQERQSQCLPQERREGETNIDMAEDSDEKLEGREGSNGHESPNASPRAVETILTMDRKGSEKKKCTGRGMEWRGCCAGLPSETGCHVSL